MKYTVPINRHGIHESHRQRDYINLLLQGKRGQEIADALGVTLKGVKAMLTQIYKNWGVKNRLALILKVAELEMAVPDLRGKRDLPHITDKNPKP